MKKIEIQGKRNVDKMKKIEDVNYVAKRNCMVNLEPIMFEYPYQVKLINQMYFEALDESINSILKKEIEKKIQSYKNQDMKKNKFNNDNITLEQVIEKLIASKLRCYYCKKPTYILYNKVRDMEQWSLDRIDNDLAHTDNNVVICCLKCNLQRRIQDKEKFLLTKNFKVNKK